LEIDVRKFTAKRRRDPPQTYAVEPFVHPNGIVAHALTDNIERDLVIGKAAVG